MPAQSSEQRTVSKQISELKSCLQRHDLDSFEECVTRAPSEALLLAVREQKLIFHLLPDEWKRVGPALSMAARSVLTSIAYEQFKIYLQFSKLSYDKRHELSAALVHLVAGMPRLTISDLACLSREAVRSFGLQWASKSLKAQVGESVAVYEHRLHTVNGRLNDYAFAVLRAVNEIAKAGVNSSASGANWKTRETAERIFKRVVIAAGSINSLDYIIDGVAYGKFDIASLRDDESGTVNLKLADEKLEIIRTGGIRRSLILRINRFRNERYVRNQLLPSQTPSIAAAISQILVDVPDALPPEDIAPIIKAGSQLLDAIDAEDDLLYAAAKDKSLELASYYYAAVALRWFAEASYFVERLQKPAIRKKFAGIPIAFYAIANCLVDGKNRALAASALNALTSNLPARSHFDLIKKPYVKSGTFHAYPLLPVDMGLWSLSVREELINGGRLGKDVGRIWEEFFAKSFLGSEWKILGEGVRLKEQGSVITDVDLLLLREDLLLVVQIKALTGSGTTQYDHWKNRKIIEWGCKQANIATQHLRQNPHAIMSIASRSIAASIKHIEPLVLTNSPLFDGWTYDNVVVAGETLRKAITVGSAIDYIDPRTNEIIRTHNIVEKRDLTTDKIRWLLRNPIELQAMADLQTRFISVKLGNVVFNIPDLELSDTAMTFREQDQLAVL
ncbi:hypothetical protein G6L05_21575 [Agrobacterium rhizogenes]|nr:hypothetical protein [Rhizobium rhizogenes]